MPSGLPADVRRAVGRLDRDAFRERLVERMFCEAHDLRDVSLVPLVIGGKAHARYDSVARRVCAAALGAFADRRHPDRFPGDAFQRLIQSLPVRQRLLYVLPRT